MKCFWSDNHGNSAIEYALILSLIAGSLVFGLEAVRFFDGADQLGSHLSGHRATVASTDAEQRAAAGLDAWQESLSQLDPLLSMRVVILGLLTSSVLIALLVSRSRRKSEAVVKIAADSSNVENKSVEQARFIAKRQEILRTLSKDVRYLMESHVDGQKVMSQRVLTVGPQTTYHEVATLMKENHVRHLLVVNARQELLGVISDRDVARHAAGTAQTIMTARPAWVTPTTPIRTAISLMLDRHISSLPVVDDGRAIGILTTTDLTMMLQCALQLLDHLDLTVKAPKNAVPVDIESSEDELVGSTL